jgi:hypothetical protein
MSSPVHYNYDHSPVRGSPVRVPLHHSPLHHSPIRQHSPVYHHSPVRHHYDYPLAHDPVISHVAPMCPPVSHPMPMCPPPRVCQQDIMISELRAQLLSMQSAHCGELNAIREEIHVAENRFRMLCDDKQKNDCEFRIASDKVCA